MPDTCAQWVLANAYISRHKLRMAVKSQPVGTPGHIFIVFRDGEAGSHNTGGGLSLYKAVLDYQEKTGIGWGVVMPDIFGVHF